MTQVVYEDFPTWTEDISKVRSYADLPEKVYIYIYIYIKRFNLISAVCYYW
jgi:adenylosuccinate synthase